MTHTRLHHMSGDIGEVLAHLTNGGERVRLHFGRCHQDFHLRVILGEQRRLVFRECRVAIFDRHDGGHRPERLDARPLPGQARKQQRGDGGAHKHQNSRAPPKCGRQMQSPEQRHSAIRFTALS